MSIVHLFFFFKTLFFLWKKYSISNNQHKNYVQKHQFGSHKVYMRRQNSHKVYMRSQNFVHHFFPLNVQILEKNFLGKSCSISKN